MYEHAVKTGQFSSYFFYRPNFGIVTSVCLGAIMYLQFGRSGCQLAGWHIYYYIINLKLAAAGLREV